MKRMLALLVAMLMLISCVGFAEEAEEPAPDFAAVDAKIITKVIDEGQIINGVRIEFDGEWTAGQITTSTFSVNGFTVVQQYLNNTGVVGEAAYTGKYVFLIFEEPVGIGSGSYGTLQYDGAAGMNSAPRDFTLDIIYGSKARVITAKGYVHAEVDNFIEGSVTDDADHTTAYRLFVPKGWEETSLPLVIWLHGAGERGDNNFTQIAANRGGLNYATARSQAAHPCFVLAPQATPDGWDEFAIDNINTIVLQLIEEYKIDASRIYVTGCSMGGGGSKSLMCAYPEMIAGSVVIANGSLTDEDEKLELMKDIPIIVITASDDSSGKADSTMVENFNLITEKGYKAVSFLTENGRNGYLRGEEAAQNLQPVVDAMAEAGVHWAFVTYLPGTVVPAAHWSWMAASENETLHDWLFSQVKSTPYTGK